MGLTNRVPRPGGLDTKSTVAFGEARRGEATPIMVWYPPDSGEGHRFIYSSR
jgi:hypothetical protein